MEHTKDQHKENNCCKETPVKEAAVCTEHNKDKALCADQHHAKPATKIEQHKK